MDYKGDNSKGNDLNNEITNIFNALVVNIDFNTWLDKDNQTIIYYTLYGEIKLNNVTAIALELANRVCSHIISTINTIIDIFPTNTDLFVYNITLYYTFIKFIGIIIDTRAVKCSIIEYSQFLTL